VVGLEESLQDEVVTMELLNLKCEGKGEGEGPLRGSRESGEILGTNWTNG
jgi:hypothetical protein